MGYVVSAVVAVAAGAACVWLLPGVWGVVAGVVAAALLYFGVGALLKPEPKLGDVAARLVPQGETAAEKVAQARQLSHELRDLEGRLSHADVRREVGELADDVDRLAAYVEKTPGSWRHLSHYLATYAAQCSSVLRAYAGVEATGDTPATAQAHADILEALAALQGAAQGDLNRAMGTQAAELASGSDAIVRLMEMDGYKPDTSGAPAEPAPAPTGYAGATEQAAQAVTARTHTSEKGGN